MGRTQSSRAIPSTSEAVRLTTPELNGAEFCWPFKGINTNWKEARMIAVETGAMETGAALVAGLARMPGRA